MFDVFSSIRSFVARYPNPQSGSHFHGILPPKTPDVPKYTLVLDLDGTLVNCSLKEPSYYDDSFINETYDEVTQTSERYTVYVQYRPYVFHFLEVMKQYYEIIVFTASTESYAKHLVDIFNKDQKIVQYCLAREYTTFVNDQEHYKDLSILNRDLKKTFILDNTPLVYSYNVNNAVPISTYKGGKDDKELFALIPFFKKLTNVEDIRTPIRDTYQLERLLSNETIRYSILCLTNKKTLKKTSQLTTILFKRAKPDGSA